jgi:hypothetical protein
MGDEFKYDLAFSFLTKDETVAQQINDALQDRCKTFIYTERQKELAGTDGEVTSKRVFGREARIVAVLFRPEWGSTKWTRIEQTAIRDRAYEDGYDFCTFISMTDHVERPEWLPKTRILYGLDRFGVSGAAVVLEARLQERGGAVHEETVAEQGQRLKRASEFAAEAERFRQSEDGVRAALAAVEGLVQELEKVADELTSQTGMKFLARSYQLNNHIVASPNAVLAYNWYHRYSNSLNESRLIVHFYDGIPDLPGKVPNFDKPRKLEATNFEFKLVGPSRPAWVSGATEVAVDRMADQLMKRLMQHNENELCRKNERRR